MIIENVYTHIDHFTSNDLYIFTIGYEHRSFYLYDYVIDHFEASNIFVFVLDDHTKYPHTEKKVAELRAKNIPFLEVNYAQSVEVVSRILQIVSDFSHNNDSISVHVDYSSMPRSWYCRLPFLLQSKIRKEDKVYFWYSEGKYPTSYSEYPSSGIESFSLFAGKPSLQIDGNRFHIVALSYDIIRTQAILSITDPSYLVTCIAYNTQQDDVLLSLKTANAPIISRAAMNLTLQLNDFSFMTSKLCELTNELLLAGDVILIPDGPKPLIFALSLVPDLVKKPGVVCLHVSRNNVHFEPVDVSATGTVFGFRISVEA